MSAVTTDQTFQQDVLTSDLPVLVDFWAPSCGPCQMLSPMLSQLAEKMVGLAKVFKVNVDENPELAVTYGIRSLPTVIAFEKGEEVKRLIGMQHPQKYIEALGLEAV